MSYAVVIEQRGSCFRAYVPDLPGCTATANSLSEAEAAVREALKMMPGGNLDGLRQAVPPPAPGYLWVSPAL
ncbi:MAG: type II toxin-antitoxin system HicB family antitoxin [Lautropia sp.]|nr:type II toxin-antitoxin system HicB family antitoxin [Lautropia sp.]